jgi:UDP-2,4-diacetamido-2,4,6-trideoxy-beta-L-altropyranose hydrolase
MKKVPLSPLIIRADATNRTGTGHLMRSLSLAQAWSRRGGQVIFLSCCENDALLRRIRAEGFGLVRVEHPHPDPGDLSKVLSVVRDVSDRNAPLWLALDGYQFDTAYQKSIRKTGIRLLVIDDYNHLQAYHADILLNQNIDAGTLLYTSDPATICLFGPQYALLRNEFLERKEELKEKNPQLCKILVTMGGADPDNVTRMAVQALLRAGLTGIEIDIVIGPANSNDETIEHEIVRAANDGIAAASFCRIHKNANMSELMAAADLAVTAGGSTCWELCFFGIPSIVVVLAENQRGVAMGIDRAGAAVSVGWHEDVETDCLAETVRRLVNDPETRRAMSRIGREIVDGQGRKRILDMMDWVDTAAHREDIPIRTACDADAFQLWKLANEPEVRCNSFNSEPIPYDQHLGWFQDKLKSKISIIFVLNVSGVLLAQVRYDRKDDSAEVGYSVIPAFRGKNLGSKILGMTWEHACRTLGVQRVQGIVKKNNKASIHSFLKAGFTKTRCEIYSGFDCVFFEKQLWE